jgi:hypothetical protein
LERQPDERIRVDSAVDSSDRLPTRQPTDNSTLALPTPFVKSSGAAPNGILVPLK